MPSGRTSNIQEIRELVALAGALTQAGDTITADAIAARIGISHAEAEHYLKLLLTAGDAEGTYLSLCIPDDESEVTLAFDGGIKGRPLRLTLAETHAVLAALNACGVPEDDELRQKIATGFGRANVTPATIERQLEPLASPEEHDVLTSISEAMIHGHALSFLYQGTKDDAPRHRHALPQELSQKDDAWYLDAFDLDRQEERCFKIERMDEAEPEEVPENLVSAPAKTKAEPARMVKLTFLDERYLSLFAWPGLKISKNAKPVQGRIPYFGTMWLPRQLAGCAGKVVCQDEEVAEKMHSYAEGLLHQLS